MDGFDVGVLLFSIISGLALAAIPFILLAILLRFLFRLITHDPTRSELDKAMLAKLKAKKELEDDDS